MATQSQVTPEGWVQYSDATDQALVTPTVPWLQVEAPAVAGGTVINPFSGRGGGAAQPVYMKAA